MASDSILPFAVGSSVISASAGALAGLLGMRIEVTGTSGTKAYRICKAGGALATPGSAVLTSALDANNLPTWVVNSTTTVSSPFSGIAPASQVALATGDYFLLQVAGAALVIGSAAIAIGAYIGTSGTILQVVGAANANAIGSCTSTCSGAGVTFSANLFAS